MRRLAKFMTVLTLVLIMVLGTSIGASAANPFLPFWEYTPDGEPYRFEDPDNPGTERLYFYPSHDLLYTAYCGYDIPIWSAPVDDPINGWEIVGSFELIPPNSTSPDLLYAPDMLELVDPETGEKTYYLFPNSMTGGRGTAIAKTDRPDGKNGWEIINYRNPEAGNYTTVGVVGFDPGVFQDPDTLKVYGYWGFETSYGAELDPNDLSRVMPGTSIITHMIPNREASNNGSDPDHFRYFEASSMRKIEDKYIFVYARGGHSSEAYENGGGTHMLAYAYGDTPLGPWTYGGVLIDAAGQRVPGTTAGTFMGHNTHGSLVNTPILDDEGNDTGEEQWWITYHRATNNHGNSRQACVEPVQITIEPGEGGKVEITRAQMSSKGFEIDGLNPYKSYPSGVACYLYNPNGSDPYIQAFQDRHHPRGNSITRIRNGAEIGIIDFNFDIDVRDGFHTELELEYLPQGYDVTMEIHIGNPRRSSVVAGTLEIAASEPQELTTARVDVSEVVDALEGQHELFIVVKADGVSNSTNVLEWDRLEFIEVAPEAIQVDGRNLPGFDAAIKSYTYTVTGDSIPVVTADSRTEGETVTVVQADELFDSAKVTFTSGGASETYIITFVPQSTTRFPELPSGWRVVNASASSPVSYGATGAVVTPGSGDYNGSNLNTLEYQGSLAGDWEITVKVTNDQLLNDPNAYPQYGIGLYGDSEWMKLVNVFGYTNTHSIQHSISTGLTGNGDNNDFRDHPYLTSWLRLTKSGGNITGAYSSDGVNFITTRTVNAGSALDNAKLQLYASTCFGSKPFTTTFEFVNLSKDVPTSFVTFELTPADAELEVKQGDAVFAPASGTMYELANGTYEYTVSAEGYITEQAEFTVSGSTTIAVALERDYEGFYTIELDGQPLEDFRYGVRSYTVLADGDIPTVTASSAASDVVASVTQAGELFESAVVRFTSGGETDTYLITFVPESTTRFDSLPGDWEILNGTGAETYASYGMTVPASRLSSGNDFPSVSMQNMLQYTGSLDGDWEVTLKVTGDRPLGGVGSYANYGIGLNNTDGTGSEYIKLVQLNSGSNSSYQYTAGFNSNNTHTTFYYTPGWLRLVKEGNSYTGLISSDGVRFTRIGSYTDANGVLDGAKLQLFVTGNQSASVDLNATFEYINMEMEGDTPDPELATITFRVSPEEAEVEVYDSENELVEPTSNPLVYELESGSYHYTVSAEGYLSESADFEVSGDATITVELEPEEEIIEPESIEITGSLSVKRGRTTQLTLVVDPEGAVARGVTWELLTPGVAEIDDNGLLTAGSQPGIVVVMATTENGLSAQFVLQITA